MLFFFSLFFLIHTPHRCHCRPGCCIVILIYTFSMHAYSMYCMYIWMNCVIRTLWIWMNEWNEMSEWVYLWLSYTKIIPLSLLECIIILFCEIRRTNTLLIFPCLTFFLSLLLYCSPICSFSLSSLYLLLLLLNRSECATEFLIEPKPFFVFKIYW